MKHTPAQLTHAAHNARLRTNGAAIRELLKRASRNADDTVYIERAAPVSEWRSLFIGTLESLLANETHPRAVVAWFARRGIKA